MITTKPTRSPAEWALAYLRFAEQQLRPAPGFCVGWSINRLIEAVERLKAMNENPPPVMNLDRYRRVIGALRHQHELRDCCIGSRAAFAKLLADRNALSDAELKAIIDRLDQVVGEAFDAGK